jgi:RND family efflux transporter MFP subunit
MLGLVAASAIYFVRAGGSNPTPPSSGASAGPVAVIVEEVARRPIRHTLTVVGVVRALRQAALSAKVPSRISAVLVQNGERVRAGQPLVRLDVGDTTALTAGADSAIAAARAQFEKAVEGKRARQTEQDSLIAQAEGNLRIARAKLRQAELGVTLTDSSATSDRDRAQAGVLQAEAGVRQAEAGYRQAAETLRRLEYLLKKGGVAAADVDGARAQAEIARGALDTARAGLAQAHAAARPAVDTAPLRTQVSQADVEAARAGVALAEAGLTAARKARAQALQIAERDVEAARAMLEQARSGAVLARSQVGGSVLASPLDGIATEVSARAGEYAQPGIALAVVVAPNALCVEVAVSARDAAAIRPGAPVRLLADEAPDSPIDATVSEVSPIANSDNRSFTVRIAVPREGPRVSVGSLAKATIEVGLDVSCVSAPVDALRSEGNTTYVWAVVDGKAVRRNVELGPTDGDHVEVLSGVRAGDRVIVSGASTLVTGAPVQTTLRRE